MSEKIAALFVDPRGPYAKMHGVDAWDESRDARLYVGADPVVTHPPCGPYGSLRKFSHDDASLGPLAVEQVRRVGGVLEHPRGSRLFAVCKMPRPGEPPDAFGGWSLAVEQVSWGHVARKPTWLYFVGVDPMLVTATVRTGGEPTHCISRPSAAVVAARGITWPCATLKATSSTLNRRTPQAFAEWLVMLASSARATMAARRALAELDAVHEDYDLCDLQECVADAAATLRAGVPRA